jgi:hypothetical protein
MTEVFRVTKVFGISKNIALFCMRLLKKRCRLLPAGVWGCPLSVIISPKSGGYWGLIKVISAFPV